MKSKILSTIGTTLGILGGILSLLTLLYVCLKNEKPKEIENTSIINIDSGIDTEKNQESENEENVDGGFNL